MEPTKLLVDVTGIVSRAANVSADQLAPDLDLIASGTIDSLSALHIVSKLERTFGVLIPEEDLEKYITIDAITAEISKLLGEK